MNLFPNITTRLRQQSARTVAIGVLMIATIGAFQSQASAQSFYPMVCKGGGGMLMSVTQTLQGDNLIELRFRRGLGPYNRATLRAGECTWTTRSIINREPTRILFTTKASLTIYLWAQYYDRAHTRITPHSTDWPTRLAQRFMTVTRTTDFFTVWVRNTNAGYFEISNIRAGD